MATSFTASVGAWVQKTEKRMTVVTKQSASDLLAGIKIAPGITRGGSRTKGTIPRDLGALARSLQSSLYGSTSMTGEKSYTLVVGAMKAGSVATFTWGGAVAPYAAAVHYGARGVPGTFWVPEAASKWQGYVDAAVAREKAKVR